MITSRKWCALIPARFAGLGTIPLQDPDLAAQELERCVRELGLRGAQIGTHVDANEHFGRLDPLNLDNAFTPAGLERGGRVRRRNLRSSLGYGWERTHAQLLAAVAGRHAGGNIARDLLDDFRRRLRAFPKTARGLCPRRRRISVHDRPHRARFSRPARPLRDRHPNQSAPLPRADWRPAGSLLCRFVSPRSGCAPLAP